MIDLILFILIILIFATWFISVFLFILYCNGDAELKILIPVVILAILISILYWRLDITKQIIDAKAGIISYQTYKNSYEFDKKIDTEIEQNYIRDLKKLEYYKSIGMYKEEPLFINPESAQAPNEIKQEDFINSTFAEILESKGDKGVVNGHSGILFGEKFWVQTPNGDYVEFR